MKRTMNRFALAIACATTAMTVTLPEQAEAANWLMLQGTEPASAAGRAKVWGFIQPEVQYTEGTELGGGGWKDQDAQFNMIAPNLTSRATFQIRRARLGVRGQGFPLDAKTNYFLLTEFGNNGITVPGGGKGAARLTDASITLNHIPGARMRVGLFKTPGSEEGLQAIHVFDYINFTNVTNQMLLERFFDGSGSGTCTAASCANKPNGPVGAFRDIGVQIFDTFKKGKWELSYAGMIGNGNGINRSDNNGAKDIYAYVSAEQVYGGKGGRREGWKTFLWHQSGDRTLTTTDAGDYDRTRWGLGSTYRKGKMRAAFEYIKAEGMIFNGTDGGALAGSVHNANGSIATFNVLPESEADGWYLHGGFMVTPKIELDLRYDVLNRGTDQKAGERKFDTLTLGAQYFFNKKTRMTVNYEMRSAEGPNLDTSNPQQAQAKKVLDSIDDRISVQWLAIF